jgi:hypothetical protein
MKNPFREVISAYRELMKLRGYRRALPVLTAIIFVIFLVAPVYLIPGNDLRFHIGTVLKPSQYVLYAALSLATSLLVLMQAFLFNRSRTTKERMKSVGRGGGGAVAAIMGGLLATAACSSCIAGLLGFLGTGTVLFAAKYNVYVGGAALLLMFVSLFITARRVNGSCNACEV